MSTKRIALLITCIQWLAGQSLIPRGGKTDLSDYVLGPGDEISIRVLDSEDIPDKPIRVDPNGEIALPLIGRIHAAGKSVAVLETDITNQLRTYIRSPQVSVNLTEFGSEPVSLLGAVTAPGVYQLNGTKTLAEMIALAKGFTPDAGGRIRITSYPRGSTLPEAGAGESGAPKVIEVSVADLLSSSGVADAIVIRPYDVITVPKARLVYVIGEVHKPGSQVLSNRESISVLEAVAQAEGPLPSASLQNAKLLRRDAKTNQRVETPIELKRILAGRAENVMLEPDDILLIPNNAARSVGLRTIEAAIQLGTGIAIWGHPF